MNKKEESSHQAVINPFITRFTLTKTEQLKMVIFGTFLLPLRAVAMTLLIIFGSLVAVICNLGVSATKEAKPYTGYRKFGQHLMSRFGRVLAFIMGFHSLKIKGKLASSEEAPVVVVAPHYSFMDAAVSVSIGHLTYMSRKENDQAPLFGPIVRLLQPIYVRRGERASREETIKEILRRSKGGAWPNLCVFPEGTCTNGESLITFKAGAFFAGVPVQPVLFRYTKDMVAWTWIGPPTLKQVVYLLTQLHNSIEVEMLPVYKPNEEEQQDAILYANNVRKVMARALGIPTSDHSFEDCCLMLEASSMKMPMESAIVEYHKISKELGLNLDKLKELFGRFALIDKNKDGLITLDEFSQHFNNLDKKEVRLIFHQIDQDNCGFIDFKSFIYGILKKDFLDEFTEL